MERLRKHRFNMTMQELEAEIKEIEQTPYPDAPQSDRDRHAMLSGELNIRRREAIVDRIESILQDGGMEMDPEDVLDCVSGSMTFRMTLEEKSFCIDETCSITGAPRPKVRAPRKQKSKS